MYVGSLSGSRGGVPWTQKLIFPSRNKTRLSKVLSLEHHNIAFHVSGAARIFVSLISAFSGHSTSFYPKPSKHKLMCVVIVDHFLAV